MIKQTFIYLFGRNINVGNVRVFTQNWNVCYDIDRRNISSYDTHSAKYWNWLFWKFREKIKMRRTRRNFTDPLLPRRMLFTTSFTPLFRHFNSDADDKNE